MSEWSEDEKASNRTLWWVVGLAVASSVGAALYHGLMWSGYGHSAAMFLGLPAVLAILLAMTPKAKTVTGGIMKGITLMLLIVAPLVGEGYLCILMASPLFYAVGGLIAWAVDGIREKPGVGKGTKLSCVALVLVPMCLEGVVPELTYGRRQMVEVTEVVAAHSDAVGATLAQSPRVGTRLPGYLRIGFPRPLEAHGEGLEVGSLRTVHFSGAEGDPPGDLVMRVTERRPRYVRTEVVSDGSKLTQWVRWKSSEVEWTNVDATHTRVTWRIAFDRELDPAWYFTPWERIAVHEAARYLIAANATPGAR